MRGKHFAIWNDTYVSDFYIIRKLLLKTDSSGITHILTLLQSTTRKGSKGHASRSTAPQSPN